MRLVPLIFVLSVLMVGCSTHNGTAPQSRKDLQNATKNIAEQQAGTTLNEADRTFPTRRIQPRYPQTRYGRRQSGCINLVFDVTPSGKPVNIQIWSSFPKAIFDRQSIKALRQWRFASTRNGKPAWRYWVMQSIDFKPALRNERFEQRIDWICKQPPPRPVQVRTSSYKQVGNDMAIATYWGETIAYMPSVVKTSALRRSVKIEFCISESGEVKNASILSSPGGSHYGMLGVAALAAWPFHANDSQDGHSYVCHLKWTVPLVSTPLVNRLPVAGCGCKRPLMVTLVSPPGRPQLMAKASRISVTSVKRLASLGATFCISKNARTNHVKILGSSGTAWLDAFAKTVLQDFRFFAQRDAAGHPVASCGWHINVVFEHKNLGIGGQA